MRTAQEGHPVLATWRHGLGRVTTFLTEPTGKGTEPWRDWDGYGPFLARVLSRTSQEDTNPYHWRLIEDGPRLRVIAERRQRLAPKPWLRRQLATSAQLQPLQLQQTADGVYEARLWRAPGEEYRLVAGIEGSQQQQRLVSSAANTPELQVDPEAELPLELLASSLGGESHPPDGLSGWVPPAAGGAAPKDSYDPRPWLLLLALLVYLFDIAYRRNSSWRPLERAA